MSASELVAQLASAGTPPELLAAVAKELFNGEAEREVLASRRRNERTRKARSRVVTGQNVTACDISPREETSTPLPSETKVSPGVNTPGAREPNPFPKPEWADPSHWRDFLANRKRRRMTNTPTAHAGFLGDVRRLADDDWPPGRLLELAARKGWGSINRADEERNGRVNGISGTGRDPLVAALEAVIEEERAERGEAPDPRARPTLPAHREGRA